LKCKRTLFITALSFCLTVGASVFAQDFSPDYTGRLVPGEWKKAWSQTLSAGISNSGLLNHHEKQIELLCPGYDLSAQKRQLFWQQLMISLAWKESLHGPRNYVNFNKGTNDGLYQINPKLRKAYGCGAIDLFNPRANIDCALRMTVILVAKFGSFLSGTKGGMAAYWQPLRATSAGNARNRNFILGTVKASCKAARLEYHSTDQPAFVDLTLNTMDDLDLPEFAIEPDTASEDYERDPATFVFHGVGLQ
jgi:hypothetical protein